MQINQSINRTYPETKVGRAGIGAIHRWVHVLLLTKLQTGGGELHLSYMYVGRLFVWRGYVRADIVSSHRRRQLATAAGREGILPGNETCPFLRASDA